MFIVCVGTRGRTQDLALARQVVDYVVVMIMDWSGSRGNVGP